MASGLDISLKVGLDNYNLQIKDQRRSLNNINES